MSQIIFMKSCIIKSNIKTKLKTELKWTEEEKVNKHDFRQ